MRPRARSRPGNRRARALGRGHRAPASQTFEGRERRALLAPRRRRRILAGGTVPFGVPIREIRPDLSGGPSMKLKPLGDRLIVKALEEDDTTASGIVLPDTAKEKPQKGKVLAVGDGKVNEDTGKRTPLDVAEGDEVLYSKYGGTEIKVDGEELLVLRESDVLAKVQS